MTNKEILSILPACLIIVGYIPYINGILRKKTTPAKATWIIWAFLDIIILAGMYTANAMNNQILASCVGASIVSLLSFKYGIPGWTKTDKLCMSMAVVGIVLWKIFENPILGIMVSLIVIFLGSVPTFISALENPSRENKTTWIIFFISCVCALIAIPHWTLEDAAQPIIFFIIELIMVYILFCRHCAETNKKVIA